jgi:hypothetical protein
MSYRCTTCGEIHHDLPDVSFDRPVYAERVPEHERPGRVQLTADTLSRWSGGRERLRRHEPSHIADFVRGGGASSARSRLGVSCQGDSHLRA